MQLADVIKVLEALAPTRFAEEWDNVGLLAGDPEQPISRALLTIDYTRAVADEAERQGCELVVSYHPPLFRPVKRLLASDLVYQAVRRGRALYSPHTALDVAPGGTNDVLADALGLAERQALRPGKTGETQFKLVTFLPEEHVERLSAALFAAGAGRIGNYSACSFRSPGMGTFFGEAGANPVLGQAGRLEFASELRVETVVPIARLHAVLAALRANHPYEEPAFDLVRLAEPPRPGVGMGRIGTLPGVPRPVLFERIRAALQVRHLLVAGPTEGEVRRAAVCAGACGDLLGDALAQRADLYLTGELRHHDALRAAEAGMTVVCVLHSNSERRTLTQLAARLGERLPGLAIHVSEMDRDPFEVR
ncbi:MAG TPA: Nif3-like dinuclear metal center hexameric protein [Polyangia bacterium]|jgi:dinuclear metal center YbgI/SA1388 family protein|nr:Nif3-like dinuclear metal center hexameric protein [Polyangia bacterium]